jgi:hypothetical protein
MSAFNDDRRGDNDELSAMLNDLPRVDPPASLVGTVMSTVAGYSRTAATQPRVNFIRRGGTMAKKVLWSVAAAAAVALVALRVAGYPPVEKGTEATIGAAQRYQAPQVAAADVKVEDQQFQEFLQSDLFRQLVNDKAAVDALKDQDLQKALTDARIRAILANADARIAIANNAKRLAQPDARAKAFADARLDAKIRAQLDAVMEASPVLARALARPHVAEAIANSSLARVLAVSDAALAVSQRAVLDAIRRASSNALNDAAANASAKAAADARNK